MTGGKPTAANGFGGVFATGRLRPLVQAASVADDPQAAWHAYCAALGEQAPDDGERRLYPHVTHRLGPAARSVPKADMLATECRLSKVALIKDTHLCARLNALLAPLDLDPIYLKGLALKTVAYPATWMRRSSDLDIFLPRATVPRAFERLTAAGWTPSQVRPAFTSLTRQMESRPALTLRGPQGEEIDLHWMPRRTLEAAPDLLLDFHQQARRVVFEGLEIAVPSPTWLLFETLDHGIKYNQIVPIRWMLDAWLLLQKSASDPAHEIDYPALFLIAERTRTQAKLQAAFRGMQEAGMALPDPVAAWLKTVQDARLEQIELWASLRHLPPGIATVMAHGPDYYLRQRGSTLGKTLGLPGHLWQKSGYVSAGQVARRLIDIVTPRR